MPVGLLFWMLMILCLIFGFWWNYRAGGQPSYGFLGMNFLTWVLLFLLGWKVFGFILQ
jgi:hypothetical protein